MSIERTARSASGVRLGGWLAVAVGSLLLAGVFAILLVVGRIPALSSQFDAGLFKRCLVVHVDLSLVVWFYAFTAALFSLLPARPRGPGGGLPLSAAGLPVTLAGLALLVWCLGLPSAQPVLSNYIPGLDHPLFQAAMAAVLLGIGLSFLDARLLPGRESKESIVPPPARPGLRAAAVAFLFALLTFVASAISMPAGLEPKVRLELLFWGGGHVLQFASEAAMLSVWLVLVEKALGRSPVSRGTAAALFGLLLLGPAVAPVLALLGVQRGEIHGAFTDLMRWGIFPVALTFLVLCMRALRIGVRNGVVRWSDPRVLTFLASGALTLVGFGLGALIRSSTTLIPAHYHANIGAVTAAFMGATPLLAAELKLALPGGRLGRAIAWQPLLYGGGQLVFVVGFALAGAHGMQRKAYGAEQHIRTSLEWAGLSVMGLGGLVAVAGGVLFLAWVLKAWAPLTQWSRFVTRSRAWLSRRFASTPSNP